MILKTIRILTINLYIKIAAIQMPNHFDAVNSKTLIILDVQIEKRIFFARGMFYVY